MKFYELDKIPPLPGVYFFKKGEEVIYIGKAKELKSRLKSYVNPSDSKAKQIVAEADKLEYIITNSELEAILLESKLIYEKKPFFNIQYKYRNPIKYISIINKDGYPYFSLASKFSEDTIEIFYPFIGNINFKELLKILGSLFGVRQCTNDFTKKKPQLCMYYYLRFCSGPCQNLISKEQYNENFHKAISFLKSPKGDIEKLISEYTGKIQKLSEEFNFEEAIIYREKLKTLQNYLNKFFTSYKEFYFYLILEENIKLLGIFSPPINLKITELENVDDDFTPVQILFDAIIKNCIFFSNIKIFVQKEYYENLLKFIQDYVEFNNDNISSQLKNIEILARENDNFVYLKKVCLQKCNYMKMNNTDIVLNNLSKILAVDNINRIEIIDVSHFGGENVYGVIVVFENKKLNRSEYRVYKLHNKFNDFENIYEMVYRRFNSIQNFSSLPQVIIIDGGKGQLNYAVKAFKNSFNQKNFEIKFISIAKSKQEDRDDKIYFYTPEKILELKLNKNILNFLLRLRDEAHRFANAKRIGYSSIPKKAVKGLRGKNIE